MRLLVLGASGGCGRWVTRLAAAEGHEVRALVRPETAFEPPPGVRVERGSVLQTADVERAFAGQQAVISCVDAQRVNARNPWPPGRMAEASARVDATAPSTRARVVKRFRAVSVISRADVAAWLLRAATAPEPIVDRTPMIGRR